ncbi:MAG: DUF4249 family protein [Flavobacteriales bacterium]|nr:DUF4249 family protein [Flavobacteriales bacterium]
MKKVRISITLVALALVMGCSTELDVNAPYKNITVVYGLLSTADKDGIHFIKINKAFLGDGDAYVFAQVPDSNLYPYDQLHAKIVRESDGVEFPLDTITVPNRNDGTFYGPDQVLYQFTAPLDVSSTYKLVIDVKDQHVEAVTPIVGEVIPMSNYLTGAGSGANLYQAGQYKSPALKFRSADNGKRYDVSYLVPYLNVYSVTDTSDTVFIKRKVGSLITSSTAGSQQLEVTFSGEDFFQSIANAVPADANVMKRVVGPMRVIFEVAGEEFNTYLALAEPISGIVEERPDYTNITNGYGLFSSRKTDTTQLRLNEDAKLELVEGAYTGSLLFCFPNSSGALSCN